MAKQSGTEFNSRNFRHGCIFCLQTDGGFSSVEHIVPESLGNTVHILPRGCVCDVCNHGILAKLDNSLVNDKFISFLRTYYMIPKKNSGMPEVRTSNTHVKVKADGTGLDVIMHNGGKKYFRENPTRDDGSIEFEMSIYGDKVTTKYLKNFARALYKIAYEFLCLDHGRGYVEKEEFDEVRQIILGVRDFNGFYIVHSGKINNSCIFGGYERELSGRKSFMFTHSFYGVNYIFDMQNRLTGLSAHELALMKSCGASILTW